VQPLQGVRVVDFSTLLPGPLATLILAEAGAEVIKIERPDGGDEMRRYRPRLGADSVAFALLNRGKRSLAIDLKAPGAVARLQPLIASSDVLVEQFRPGVMDRLGLGFAAVEAINPRIVYCSITGYGQTGPKTGVAGHDLNYIADTGLLALGAGAGGATSPPPALVADIGGGALPAVINILLALRQAAATGRGCQLDVAMCDGLFAWQFWAIGQGQASGRWPRPGGELFTGGSPRYQLYPTADQRFVATAALEQRFWDNFCALIGLASELRDDAKDPAATRTAVAAIIARRTADEWDRRFRGRDVCCNVVRSVEAALADPHFRARGLFERELVAGDARVTALPPPLAPVFRGPHRRAGYPRLGEAAGLLDEET
jgi:crotonobetainyl-CoA:carnitine CoA-transferase CaiB-like acyl-CoA transferase